jgi:thiol-disulfide isomerase/thioredoxin
MKTLISLLLLSLALPSLSAPPQAGTKSRNFSFALDGTKGFKNTRLGAYDGGILVIMFMTPWCPICQSYSKSVGDDILKYYNSGTRGKLRGKNLHGVPVSSVLLSTEPAVGWDLLNEQFATRNGFDRWGLDARPNRARPRTLLGYFRGGFIPSANLYDWGDDRRRLVVINLNRKSTKHAYREILVNQTIFTTADVANVRSQIDSVKPSK